MTNHSFIIQKLTANWQAFEALLAGASAEEAAWQPEPGQWSLLQIVCHLLDEEREDFRARLRHVLEQPQLPMPSIDAQAWVQERAYQEQSFDTVLSQFLEERAQSVMWLQGLGDAPWDQAYVHPVRGPLPASLFLANWLAHDYHHIRQINRVKYLYLRHQLTDQPLDYAGTW